VRILVIFCHPSGESFGAALFALACRTLRTAGHELRTHDLYAEGFDPVMRREEWGRYLADPQANIDIQAGHVADLRWCEALLVIYPTWYYGPPAMLKGWLERVWLPGVTFEIPKSLGARPKGKLRNIRLFVGITTSGSPWWWMRLIRDPGRSLWTRGLRPIFHPRCRYIWRQLYSMNHRTETDRTAFLARVERTLARFGGPT
jgi:putative NADPH-quinone reductase